MSFRRTPVATLRLAAVFAALLSLLLTPGRARPSSGPCPTPASMECGGCCEAMACCVEAPKQPAPPVMPPAASHGGSDFSVALMAATRPLLGLLPTGQHDFVPQASAPLGRSPDSLALLCIRLI